MAGLFRQLAEQALQTAPRLHPLAVPQHAQHAQHAPEHSLSEEQAWADPDRSAVQADRSQSGSEMRHAARILPPQPVVTPQRSTDMTLQHAGHETFSASLPRAPRGRPQDPVQTMSVDDESLARPPLDQRMAYADADTDAHRGGSTDTKPSPPRHAPLRPGAEPLPLRPMLAVATRPSPSQPRPDSTARASRSDADAVPEVHIHIGRIELTAVTPPAAGKRASATGKQPLSLDDYLKQRGRKAP